jgi:hypothetical protein
LSENGIRRSTFAISRIFPTLGVKCDFKNDWGMTQKWIDCLCTSATEFLAWICTVHAFFYSDDSRKQITKSPELGSSVSLT